MAIDEIPVVAKQWSALKQLMKARGVHPDVVNLWEANPTLLSIPLLYHADSDSVFCVGFVADRERGLLQEMRLLDRVQILSAPEFETVMVHGIAAYVQYKLTGELPEGLETA